MCKLSFSARGRAKNSNRVTCPSKIFSLLSIAIHPLLIFISVKFFDPNPPSDFSSPLNWPTSKFYNLVLQSEELRRTFTSGLVDVLGMPNRREDVLTMANSLEETGRDHRVPQRIYGLLISLTPRPTASVISSALRTVFGLQESTLPLTFAELTCKGRCDGVPQGEPNSPQLCSGSCILWQTAFATCFEACASCWEDGEIAGATCIDNASGFVAEGGRNFRSSRESLGNLRCWGGFTCFKACTGFLYDAFDMSSFRTR